MLKGLLQEKLNLLCVVLEGIIGINQGELGARKASFSNVILTIIWG